MLSWQLETGTYTSTGVFLLTHARTQQRRIAAVERHKVGGRGKSAPSRPEANQVREERSFKTTGSSTASSARGREELVDASDS
jgi:hypothetical protein